MAHHAEKPSAVDLQPSSSIDPELEKQVEEALVESEARFVGVHLPHDPDHGLSHDERVKVERKLLWRLDFRLIPWLCLLYLISFLDRTNIGNAKLIGGF
jgi:hypothetical protein